MAIHVDWDKMGDQYNLPEGSYECEVVQCDQKRSDKGEFFQVTFKILDGEIKDRQFTNSVWFTEKAGWKAKWLCSSLGIKTEGTQVVEPYQLEGRRCIVNAFKNKGQINYGYESMADLSSEDNSLNKDGDDSFDTDDLAF